MCSATQAVKCGVASSSPSSLASVSLSFRSTCTILLFHIVVLILLVVILYQFIQLFTRSHFSHMFPLYSHGISGVVFTGSKRRICSISTTNNVYSSLVTSLCDDCSASFLSAGDCARVMSRPPPSMHRLLDVAVLNLALDLCSFLLFGVKLGINLGLVL